MRRAMPGCIAAIWSTVRAPCFVVARTRAPGIRASSIDAQQRTRPSRTFRLAGLHFLDGVFDDCIRSVDARRVQEPAEPGRRVDLEDVRCVSSEDHVDAADLRGDTP